MTTPQPAMFSNGVWVVDEFFTEAKIEALNSELLRREISSEQVIAVLPVAGQIMVSPTPPQFPVLYRTN
jgi:hypothetical protein